MVKTNVGVFGAIGNVVGTNFPLPPLMQYVGGVGVLGRSELGSGVYGISEGPNNNLDRASNAVVGDYLGVGGAGIYGQAWHQDSVGVYGANANGGVAGRFVGKVEVLGSISSSAKSFSIYYPLDPSKNKYLNHWSMQSDELLNVYSGSIT